MTDTAASLLSAYTTLALGGPTRRIATATSEDAAVAEVLAADVAEEPLLILGGGSNVVIADEGFPGTVLLLRDVEHTVAGDTITAAAGLPWDRLVEVAIAHGLAGVEALSGIPGSVGATPVQNVGAYGQDVSQTISSVRVLDRRDGKVREMRSADCGFGYRSSVFKTTPGRFVVLSVTFTLSPSTMSKPVAYTELARTLGIEIGGRAPLADVRAAVLGLRASKGMLLDPDDPDTRSVGSFFTNPIVSAATASDVAERAGSPAPQWPEADGGVKLSAAWLVQQAGFHPGYGSEHARISTKHTLALTHPGGGSTRELLALAREIRDGVSSRFGVELVPEPVLVGCAL